MGAGETYEGQQFSVREHIAADEEVDGAGGGRIPTVSESCTTVCPYGTPRSIIDDSCHLMFIVDQWTMLADANG